MKSPDQRKGFFLSHRKHEFEPDTSPARLDRFVHTNCRRARSFEPTNSGRSSSCKTRKHEETNGNNTTQQWFSKERATWRRNAFAKLFTSVFYKIDALISSKCHRSEKICTPTKCSIFFYFYLFIYLFIYFCVFFFWLDSFVLFVRNFQNFLLFCGSSSSVKKCFQQYVSGLNLSTQDVNMGWSFLFSVCVITERYAQFQSVFHSSFWKFSRKLASILTTATNTICQKLWHNIHFEQNCGILHKCTFMLFVVTSYDSSRKLKTKLKYISHISANYTYLFCILATNQISQIKNLSNLIVCKLHITQLLFKRQEKWEIQMQESEVKIEISHYSFVTKFGEIMQIIKHPLEDLFNFSLSNRRLVGLWLYLAVQ